MRIQKIEIQDDQKNIYYPHTDSSVVKYKDSTAEETLDNFNTQLNASTNIQDISLVNGWVEYGEGFSKPKCIKIGKMIMVSGIIRNGTSSTIGYLPEGYRPEKTEPVCVELGDKTLVSGLIGNDGVLLFPGAESKNSTISFNFSFISK